MTEWIVSLITQNNINIFKLYFSIFLMSIRTTDKKPCIIIMFKLFYSQTKLWTHINWKKLKTLLLKNYNVCNNMYCTKRAKIF